MITSFAQIEELARAKAGDPQLFACVEPHDPTLLEALDKAVENKLVKPVLIGDEQQIYSAAKEAGIEVRGWELVRSANPNESAYTALELVKHNKVDALAKGVFGVRDFLSILFERNLGFRVGKNLVSGVMAVKVEQLERLLLLGDPVVNPAPELTHLISIVNNTAATARKLGYELPKVALLAAVEVIYPQMPVTTAEAVIAKMSDRGQIKGCLVDGPLSLDVALIESAAREKSATGEVAGKADVLIGPNLAVSYGVAKAFSMYTSSEYGLVTVGGKVPAVITSSNDNVQAKYNSLLLAIASN